MMTIQARNGRNSAGVPSSSCSRSLQSVPPSDGRLKAVALASIYEQQIGQMRT
jgi:hypothetical protein